MRVLAVLLVLAAVGAAVVSWSGRHALRAESFMATAVDPGTRDVTPAGRDLSDETIDAHGFDAYADMRADDSRLWLGVAIALFLAAITAWLRRPPIAALVLLGLAAGCLVVSLVNDDHLRVRMVSWTSYTPVDTKAIADDYRRRVTAYDAMPWDDARLWLGLAIGFAVTAAGVGGVALRRRP
jgi:energy-converting hydrogenase Eha subunit C